MNQFFDPNYQAEEYKKFNDEEDPQPESDSVILFKKIVRILIAIIIIGGLIYISGIYQSIFYRETPETNYVSEITNSSLFLDAEVIRVPLKVFILSSDGPLGSERTIENARNLVNNAQQIWNQAAVNLGVRNIQIIESNNDRLKILLKNPHEFIDSFGQYDPSVINIFLIKSLGGINGIAYIGHRSAAVADFTSVNDFRALAHEIGHLLGLSHVPGDRGRLMYRGANGDTLTLEEINRARSIANQF